MPVPTGIAPDPATNVADRHSPGTKAKVMKISFEFFPPRTPAAGERLWATILELETLQPAFVSVTYGAGGSTRERTHATVRRILHQTSLTPAAHLTCMGASRAEIEQIARDYWRDGVRHLVALRGDKPSEADDYTLKADGFASAAELVPALRRMGDFDISVAGYPEVHPDAVSTQADIDYLRRKVDAGASRVITQFCFDDDQVLRFRDRAAASGIDVPIVPGVLPIANFAQVARFARSCGASIPGWLERRFDGLEPDSTEHQMVAAALAASQCQRLLDEGCDQFHFYTMNRAALPRAVCRAIGVLPRGVPPREDAEAETVRGHTTHVA